jgi:hypothetical protein
MKIIIKNARLAFPKIYKPEAVGNSDPRYGATLLFEKQGDNHKRILAAINQVALEKWEDRQAVIMRKIMSDSKSYPLLDGDEKTTDDGEPYNGYEGMMYLRTSAAQKDKPTVLDRDKTPLLEDNGRLYAGCYVNASVDIWALDHKEYGKKVCAKLLGVQFYKDGDAFAGGARVDLNDFEDLSDMDETDEIDF